MGAKEIQKIVVLGTGYVGLPLALLLAKHGKQVVGVDINENLVKAINEGTLNLEEEKLQRLLEDPEVQRHLIARSKPEHADAFVISVPTPLDGQKKVADLSYVKEALRSILPYLKPGNLVNVESTIPPLTTRNVIKPMIEEAGFKVGHEIYLAHCPERILPGDVFYEIVHNDRIIGGINEESARKAAEIYRPFLKGEIYLTDDLTAELCKIMENTYRDVNVALANEFALVCENLDVDPKRVIELANKHPRVHILKPGIGVGGHCLPIDPWFLHEVDPENTTLIIAARRVNDQMPGVTAGKIRRFVACLDNPKILALGASYKPETYDTRESPAIKVVQILQEEGYRIAHYDPIARGYREHYRPLRELLESERPQVIVVLVAHQVLMKELEENQKVIEQQGIHVLVFH